MKSTPASSLQDKVVLITGGASGMGRVMALRLSRAGAKVAIVDRSEAALAVTAQQAPGIHTFACDVSDARAIEAVAQQVEQEIGAIYRLAVSAGIMPAACVADMPIETFAKVMRVNYEGLVSTVKAVLPGMQRRGRGQIVLFGSLAGVVFSKNFAAYGASKAAVNAFGEVLAHELAGSGIQVLTVRPAGVATPLIKQATGAGGLAGLRKQAKSGRMATPDQIIDAVEAGLAKGRYVVYPTAESRIGAWLRRVAPEFTWHIANAASRET